MDKRHPLAQKDHLTLEDISSYRFIIHNSGATRDSIDEWRNKNFINLDVHMETNSISSILTTIKDSNYLSLVSENAISHHQALLVRLCLMPQPQVTSHSYTVMIDISLLLSKISSH